MKLFSIFLSLLLFSSSLFVEVIGSPSRQDESTPTRFKYARRGVSTSSQESNSISLSPSSSSSINDTSSFSPIPTSTSSIDTSGGVNTGDLNSKSSSSIGFSSANSTNTTLVSSTISSALNATATSTTLNTTASTTASPLAPLPANGTDQVIVVLQLAFILETLEFEFYETGLEKFGIKEFVSIGYSPEQASIIIEELQLVVLNEQNHVAIIEETILALGAQPFKGCGFALEGAFVDPIAFISTARTLEAVGISAYAGAAHLVSDPQLLTAVATILPIESRHSALLNTLSGGTLGPQSFEIALDVGSVLALSGGFLKNCSPADLGLVANEPLGIVEAQFGSTFFTTGSLLVFAVSIEIDITVLFCQMIVGGSPAALVLPANACAVPAGIDGPVAVYLTNSSTPLASNIIIQAKAQIVAGPGIIFVDSRTTLFASLFVPPLIDTPLYSVDMGGYWVEKRKGVHEPKLVKTGSRHYPNSTSHSSQIMNRRNKISLSPGGGGGQSDQRRSRSVPDSLLHHQGVYRRSDDWVEDD
ncbi:hypothetical protein JCM5350_005260 [Sporobolomyces pararoseus]